MSERQIDDAIDAAVRDLMNVDTDPAFRARVVERLHEPKPRAGLWRQLSFAAAALVVVIGLMFMRGAPRPPVEPRSTQVASAPPPRATGVPAPAPTPIQKAPPVDPRAVVRGPRRPSGELT